MESVAGTVDHARPVQRDWDEAKTRILASNTAQGVHKHLRSLESNRTRARPRWIWELLQNARDVAEESASLIATVEVRDGELTFRHNGRGFEPDEITHLIYYGSTKLESDTTVGQFGSGFLTTHLLSPIIDVSGRLTDGQTFTFRLDRGGDSVAELQHRMDASFEAFKSSLATNDDIEVEAATTFRYPINDRASDAVEQGARALARTGPYVTAFNPEFKCIQILRTETKTVLELTRRRVLAENIKEVQVAVSGRGDVLPDHRCHVVAELDDVAVAIPIVRQGEHMALRPTVGAPKLLLGFPLTGTEDFSFPAVIHSLRFSPTEERDGVYLGQSDDSINQENQSVLEQACRLVILTAKYAAESGWSNIHLLADIPSVRDKRWLNPAWLRDCLKVHLVDPLRSTPSVLTECGGAVAPATSSVPTAHSPEAVDDLWSLASNVTALKDTLPRRAEAPGWCSAARSWATLYECSLDDLEETIDGHDLGRRAAQAESIKALQDELSAGDAAEWLSELHQFLLENRFDDALRHLSIIPDQNGQFRALHELHRDQGIPEELKNIAELAGWNLRAKLRDSRFSVVADEAGAGDIDCDLVVPKLVDRIRSRMKTLPNDDAKVASVRLFAWIAASEEWRHLDGFPAFSAEKASNVSIKLIQHEDVGSERPLAPVPTWPKTLREYADLFPRRQILADDFAASFDDSGIWNTLDDRGFIRRTVLYTQTVVFNDFLPDEPLPESDEGKVEHKIDGTVSITNVAYLTKSDIGVLPRVRQSRSQAQLFWDFLTHWLAVEDATGLQAKDSMCVCGLPHRYYPAAWLVPLVNNQWVPLRRRCTDRATAHSLARLVRDTEWPSDLLRTSPQVVALLKALRISVPELIMELYATDADERSALDETLAQLLTSVGSEWNRLRALAEDIQDDNDLFDHLEERREHRRMVRENQRLGALVENLVRESLERKGFDVRRTSVGSDFAIKLPSAGEDEQVRLELTRGRRTWLVEIKSTRDDSVRMTLVQAHTAVEHDRSFLLCVVPIGPAREDPNIQSVRNAIRFVDGIGTQLADICSDLEDFESFRATVTVEDAAGFRLELDSGSPRVRVASSVWQTGFGLEELFARLTAPDSS